jgi:serine/threonine protein kinase
MPTAGDHLGRYELRSQIGAGGMAEVFSAWQHTAGGLRRNVVVKCLRPELLSDPAAVARMREEARISMGLHHPGVVTVHDFGFEAGHWFLVLEEIDGPSLSACMAALGSARSTLPVDEAMLIVADVADALDHVHGRRDEAGRPLHLVHRDVCPANILLDRQGRALLADFGIARVAGATQELAGHEAYLAPEIWTPTLGVQMARVGQAVDRFALGVVLYELLTSQRLYRGGRTGPDGTVHPREAILAGPPGPPSARRAGVPPSIDSLCLTLLSKEPNERPDAGQVRDLILRELGAVAPVRARLADRLEGLRAPTVVVGSDVEEAATIVVPSSRLVPPPPVEPRGAQPKAERTPSLELGSESRLGANPANTRPPLRLAVVGAMAVGVVVLFAFGVARFVPKAGPPAPPVRERAAEAVPAAAPADLTTNGVERATEADIAAPTVPTVPPSPTVPPRPTVPIAEAPTPEPAPKTAATTPADPTPTGPPAPTATTHPRPAPVPVPAAETRPAEVPATEAAGANPDDGDSVAVELRVSGDYAWFTVDGVRQRKAARSSTMTLTPGTHHIRAEFRTSGEVVERTVVVSAGGPAVFTFEPAESP